VLDMRKKNHRSRPTVEGSVNANVPEQAIIVKTTHFPRLKRKIRGKIHPWQEIHTVWTLGKEASQSGRRCKMEGKIGEKGK